METQNGSDSEQLLTTPQAAKYFNVSVAYLARDRWIAKREGKSPSSRFARSAGQSDTEGQTFWNSQNEIPREELPHDLFSRMIPKSRGSGTNQDDRGRDPAIVQRRIETGARL